MKDKKRVIQISLDIVVGAKCDGIEFAEDVANELERRGFKVIGAGFQEDLTEFYKECFPDFLEV